MSGKAAGRVSTETEKVVRRAAADLGYRPNAAARALRTGAARSIALIVPDVTNPFFGHVMRGAQAAAWTAGYAVALVDTANDPAWELGSYEALRGGPVDGFLVFGIDPPKRRRGTPGEKIVLMEDEAPGHPPAGAAPGPPRGEDGPDGGRGARPPRGAPRQRRRRRRRHGAPPRPRPPPHRPDRRAVRAPRVRRPRGALARGADRRRHRPRCDALRPQRDQLPRSEGGGARPARGRRTADRDLLRRRHPGGRRLPRRARARAADPARRLGRRLRRPRLHAAAPPPADDRDRQPPRARPGGGRGPRPAPGRREGPAP